MVLRHFWNALPSKDKVIGNFGLLMYTNLAQSGGRTHGRTHRQNKVIGNLGLDYVYFDL